MARNRKPTWSIAGDHNTVSSSWIGGLVRTLLDTMGRGPLTAAWERQLNAVVYEVYRLGAEETTFINKLPLPVTVRKSLFFAI